MPTGSRRSALLIWSTVLRMPSAVTFWATRFEPGNTDLACSESGARPDCRPALPPGASSFSGSKGYGVRGGAGTSAIPGPNAPRALFCLAENATHLPSGDQTGCCALAE